MSNMSWYFKGIPHFKSFKMPLMTATGKQEVIDLLDQILVEVPKALDQEVTAATVAAK